MATAEQLGIGGSFGAKKKTKVRKKKAAPKPTTSVSSVQAITGAKGETRARKQARRIRKSQLPEIEGFKIPRAIAREQERELKETQRKAARDLARYKRHETMHPSLLEGGIVGQIDPEFSASARKLVYGKKNPSAGEVLAAQAPIPAFRAAKLTQTALRGAKGLKTAEKAAKGRKVVKAAKKGRKAKTAAQKAAAKSRTAKARATGRGMSAAAVAQLSKVERRARRAQRADRALRAATSPSLAAAATAPGDIGHQVRENLEATFVPGKAANPLKTAHTTLKAVPGLFAAGASVGGGAYRSAKTGDPKYITGAVKGIGEGSKELLAPLVEGDSEEIAKAMEEDIGYPFAPLLPKGAVSKPAKAAGKTVAAPVKAVAKPVRKVARTRAAKRRGGKPPPTEPGKLRSVRQRVTGGKKRRDVAVSMARPRERATREGMREAKEIVGERIGRTSKPEQMISAAAVVARYGIGRKTKNPVARLDEAVRGMRDEGTVVNDREIAAWLKENPDVLKRHEFWETVDQWRAKQDPKVTSKRAQFMAQADVAGVEVAKSPRMLRKEAKQLTKAGKTEEAAALRASAKELQAEIEAKGVPREKARESFGEGDVARMVEEVRAKRSPDLEDPIWLAEPRAKLPVESSRASKVGLKQHASTGANRRSGQADRSLQSLLENSVIFPHVRTGTARGIRDVVQKRRITAEVDGKTRNAFTVEEAFDLHNKGEIDLREVAFVPSRDWDAAMRNEAFDLETFYGKEIAPALRGDMDYLQRKRAKGTKGVLVPREVGRELDYQLNPNVGDPLSKGARGVAGIASRVVLYSPAWAAAQVVNETSQLIADAGVRGVVGGTADLIKLRFTDPKTYRAILDHTATGSPVKTPFGHKVGMSKGDYVSTSRAVRGLRRYGLGRALLETPNVFANFDRAKTTRIRAIGELAKTNKEFGQFTRGVAASLRSMDEISQKLAKMSRTERHKFVHSPAGQKILDGHLDHLDDMLGNWEAFTRYERSFGPLLAFYPYVRMSLRWTFNTYPKKHPIKAQILYLLSQQNRDQLSKLIGHDPSMFQSAFPVLYNEEGEADAVMPGGGRFGSPSSNVFIESIGEENIAGLGRMLNPALSTGLFAFSGVSPFTGKQEAPIGSTEWGLNALEALLSTFPPARATSVATLQPKSDAAKVFDNIDPERVMRSALNPFIPLSAERFKMQAILGDALEAAQNEPEYGDLVDALLAKDTAKVNELAKRVDLAKEAQDIIKQFLPSSKAEEAAVGQAGEIIREGTKATKPSKAGSNAPSWASSGGSAGGGSNKPAWAQ